MAAQGLVKTKYTSSRHSRNEKRGGIMLTVKSASQMEQSDTQMTPQSGARRKRKKPKNLILFYFVLSAKKLVRETQEPMKRQNALSLLFEIGGSYINIHTDIYIHTHTDR